MRLSSALIILTAVSFTACASQTNPQTEAGGQMPPQVLVASDQGPQLSNDDIARRLLAAVNKERASSGLKPLEASPDLARSAQEHSEKMMSGNFLSTRGTDEPSVVARITSRGVKTLKLGEDVVRIKTGSNQVADETLSIWMGAAANRKNILSPTFTRTGIGVARADDGDFYVSQDFAQ
jgi:uncharacterized protein YkwD